MALPTIANNDVLILKYTGQDVQVIDMLNVQLYQYSDGLTPVPGGLNVRDVATAAFAFWGNFWKPFQTSEFSWFSCSCLQLQTVTPIAPNRWKGHLRSQWTVNGSIPGTAAGPTLPSYNAYSIQKLSSAPGRGRQGHIRISGIPTANVNDNQIFSIPLAAINLALAAPSPLTVTLSVGFSDIIFPITLNGKLINTTPGNPPAFYADTIDGLVCHLNIGSQISRKLARHRS